jgi:hypothetical protein
MAFCDYGRLRPTLHCGEGPWSSKCWEPLKHIQSPSNGTSIKSFLDGLGCQVWGTTNTHNEIKKDKNNFHVKLCDFENLNLFWTFSKKINRAFLSWWFMNFAPTYIKKICPSHSQLLGPIFFHLHSKIIQLIFTKYSPPFQTFWASDKLFTHHF